MEPLPGLDLDAPPFDLLDAAARRRLQRSVDMGFHPAGEVILEAGTASSHVHVILKGVVRAWDLHAEGARLFADFDSGDMFGAWAVIAGRARHRYQAVEDVLDFLIPAALFRELLDAHPRFAAWFHEGLALKRRVAADEQQPSELSQLMLTRVRDAHLAPAVQVPATTTIQEAAQRLREARVDCLLVEGRRGRDDGPGIVTRTDLLEAMALEAQGRDAAVGPLARRPLIEVRARDVLFQALVTMTEHGIERVPVRDDGDGNLLGTLGMAEVLAHYTSHSHLIQLRLERARSLDDVAEAARGMTALVRQLHAQGARMSYLMELVSALNSRILARVFDAVVPADRRDALCLLVLGSEGRREQILKTDQDNALVIADGHDWDGLPAAMARFGEALRDIGYPPCPGGVMATRPDWRMPERRWRERIAGWAREPDGAHAMALSIMLDARPVAGNTALFAGVEDALHALGRDELLLRALARATLEFSTPLDLFGRMRDGGAGMDLKKGGVFPIVHGIRVLALRHGVRRHNTFDRCEALRAAGALSSELGRDLPQALAVFLRLRLGAQLQALAAGEPVDNRVHPASLRRLDRELLRDAFRVVNAFKDHVRDSFHLRAG
ncbi:cyclic nucleotide-binding/CBS domain-containing protein [Lysobacter sp. SG-8]|uniref:Cyclic nucleotide-binding/CBS domain-containing protein n=1 Tax=Marilutibacter penaei TaxID=2759900 RepID=A0A7W3U555_9GAMM|nr:putative nucleotidyltransferase substrate binding domain-containing protein [Lysobacter penaei]MBB1088765.1 cyclic nucleotide-binding/CBS domain-containing protein [Lysobacter penaei]